MSTATDSTYIDGTADNYQARAYALFPKNPATRRGPWVDLYVREESYPVSRTGRAAMTPAEARELAAQLVAAADEIEQATTETVLVAL